MSLTWPVGCWTRDTTVRYLNSQLKVCTAQLWELPTATVSVFVPLPHPNPFFFLACEALGLWVSCIMWPQAYLATLSGHTMSQHIARKSKGRRVSSVLSSPKPLRLGIPSPHVRDNTCWWTVCPNHLAVPRNQTDPHTGFVKCYMNYNSDRKKKQPRWRQIWGVLFYSKYPTVKA